MPQKSGYLDKLPTMNMTNSMITLESLIRKCLYCVIEILISATIAILTLWLGPHGHLESPTVGTRAALVIPIAAWCLQFWFFLDYMGLIPRKTRNSVTRNSE